MNLNETFRIAINSLLINRLRSALTTLGIIIGVGAVIGLVSLGRGVEAFIADEFSDLGANVLEISSTRPESLTRTRVEPLTTVEADALANPIIAPSIRRVAATYGVFGVVVAGAERTQTGIRGASANYAVVNSWAVRYGSFITPEQEENAARVAVIGLDIVEVLFGDRDFNPIGQVIRINQRVFTVIGVMEERGSTFVSENNVIFIPLSTAQTRLDSARARDGGYRVSTIFVEVVNEDAIPQARQEIYAYLDEAHNVVFSDERDYAIASDAGLVDSINQISRILTIFLVMIASISLLVGGIGIMNIMLVSVTERTREIGLRKAVGAQRTDILLQFVMESTMLSLIGGALGIGVGWLAAVLGTALINNLTITVSPDAVLLAVGVSTGVGIFFGFYPAWRAAQMKPIDALRYE